MELLRKERARSRPSRNGKPSARPGAAANRRAAAQEVSAETSEPDDRPRPETPSARHRRDHDWLQRIGNGETGAFNALFSAYYSRLCLLARTYLRSPELAEEVVGEVFAHIWEQRETLHVRENLNGYLHVAVRHRALKQLERIRVELRWSDEASRGVRDSAMSQAPPSAEEELLAAELADAIEHAVESLPARSRQAYTLHRQQHLSYAEIAKIMGISVRTVENNVARAVRLLRERLVEWLT